MSNEQLFKPAPGVERKENDINLLDEVTKLMKEIGFAGTNDFLSNADIISIKNSGPALQRNIIERVVRMAILSDRSEKPADKLNSDQARFALQNPGSAQSFLTDFKTIVLPTLNRIYNSSI